MKSLNKNDSIQRGNTAVAVKAGFWYVASTVILKGLAFITTPIFARLMSAAAYGEFSNYASWQATLLIMTSAELYNTLGRAYYDFKDQYDQYASSIVIASMGTTLLFYILFLLSGDWIYNIVSIPKQYVHMLFFTLMFQACRSVFLARERTLYRYKTVATLTVLNLLVPTLISVILVIIAPDSQKLSARIYGNYLPTSLIGVGCAAVLLYKGKSFNIKHCWYAFKLALPMMAHYLSAYVLTSTNTIMTKNFFGAQTVAIVSIASSTIHILTVVFQALSGALTTWVMDNLEQNKREKIRRNLIVYVGFLAAVSVVVILFAPEVVWILGGTKYRASAFLVPGLIVGAFIQGLTTVFTIILTYDKNIAKTAFFTGVISVMNIGAKFFLLPLVGYAVLPYISIATNAIIFVINYLLVKRAGYGDTINFRGITMIILVVITIMAFHPLLYQYNSIRYVVILVFSAMTAMVLWKNRKLLLSILKSTPRKKA